MNKIVVTCVIALFFGIGFQPAFANDIQVKENNSSFQEFYEEIVFSIYGVGNKEEKKILLTNEQADKLESIFEELDIKIRNSESSSQTIDIIKWAFDSFQEFNLFNKNDEKIIKGLLINLILNSNFNYKIESVTNRYPENFNCLMSGYFESSLNRFHDGEGLFLKILLSLAYHGFIFLPILAVIILLYRTFFGLDWGGYVAVGHKIADYDPYYPGTFYYKCGCGIITLGTNGFVTWDGDYYGQIRIVYSEARDDDGDLLYKWWDYVGVEGYTGIKFTNFMEKKSYVLGFAQQIAMDTELP